MEEKYRRSSIRKTHCPVQAHFGLQDSTIPISDVENFISLRPEVETYIYDDHGFSCHHRKQYHKSSANLAQERADVFLGRHIQNTN